MSNLASAAQVASGGDFTSEHVEAPELRALLENFVASCGDLAYATLLNSEYRGISAGCISPDEFLQRELEHAAPILLDRMRGEHADALVADRRIDRDDAVDALAGLFAKVREQPLASFRFQDPRHQLAVFLPALEVEHRLVQLAPRHENQAFHSVGVLDREVDGDGRTERDGDDGRALHREMIEQARKVARLIDERESVLGNRRPGVPSAVVDEAAMVARELGDLVLPILRSVDLAVDEDEVRPRAAQLAVEVAAVDRGVRHDRLS